MATFIFSTKAPTPTQIEKDEVLKSSGAESVVGELQALPVDVEPDGDFDGLCEYLEQWGTKRQQAGFSELRCRQQRAESGPSLPA